MHNRRNTRYADTRNSIFKHWFYLVLRREAGNGREQK